MRPECNNRIFIVHYHKDASPLFVHKINRLEMIRHIDRPIRLVSLRELFDKSVVTNRYFALIFG